MIFWAGWQWRSEFHTLVKSIKVNSGGAGCKLALYPAIVKYKFEFALKFKNTSNLPNNLRLLIKIVNKY